MVEQVYRPRRPKESPLWQCLCAHFYDFIQAYPDKYEKKYGFLKPLVEDVVNKYLDCGDLTKGLPFRFAPLLPEYGQPVSLRSARPHLL